MNAFILIIMLHQDAGHKSGASDAIAMQEFDSEAACAFAATEVAKRRMSYEFRALCVPKGAVRPSGDGKGGE